MGAEHLGKGTENSLPARGFRNRSVEIAEAKAWTQFRSDFPDFPSSPSQPSSPAVRRERVRVRKPALPTPESSAKFRTHVRLLPLKDRQEYVSKWEEKILNGLFDVEITETNEEVFRIGPKTVAALTHMSSFRQGLVIGKYVYQSTDEELITSVSRMQAAPSNLTIEDMLAYRNETMLQIGFRLGLIDINDIPASKV